MPLCYFTNPQPTHILNIACNFNSLQVKKDIADREMPRIKVACMIKVMEQFLPKEQLNNVGLSFLKTDESNIWLRSINMSDKEKLNRERLFIVSSNADSRSNK